MNLKIYCITLFITCFSFGQISAQFDAPNTVPDESPIRMKPEMTEIWEPEVALVQPAKKLGNAPSDAVILFDGNHLDQWVNQKSPNQTAPWNIVEGKFFEVVPNSGAIQTKMKFGDCQLHIEFSAPDDVKFSGQGRGNSDVFFQNRYELQVLDSYQNRTYRNGQAGSIYKDHAPLVNAMNSPLEWNVYDVIYTAPRFKPNGVLDSLARPRY